MTLTLNWKYYAAAAMALLAFVFGWSVNGWRMDADLTEAQTRLDALNTAIQAQKDQAGETLRAAQEAVKVKQQQIDEQHQQQEKTDASNKRTLDDLRAQLGRLRVQTASATSWYGGHGAAGQTSAGAVARAADAAKAERILSGAADPEADDAYDADVINAAYTACRARVMLGVN
jgi:peptidoglycan hydrolase CwlO-like protein